MAVLINRTYPNFRILNPATGLYAQFAGGKLTIEPDDPNYDFVMEAAKKYPEIIVTTKVVQCPECGETFTGGAASLELGKHRKNIHPLEWEADREASLAEERNAIIQSRQPFTCDVCQPLQEFGTADDLALHVRTLHGSPFVNADGKGVPEEVKDELEALPSGG